MPATGTHIVLRHSQRDHPGIVVDHCADFSSVGLTLHHCGGLGILSQFSRDLRFTECQLVPAPGRLFSGHDDGLHCSNCAGHLAIEGCRFAGLADDSINIHGTVLRIHECLDARRLRLRFVHRDSWGLPVLNLGDTVAILDRRTLADRGTARITAVQVWSPEDLDITCDRDLPAETVIGDAVENRTLTPSTHINNCIFDPGRGILISTPQQVVIEGNVFRTAGSAILIAGDANEWFESGAVRDVMIRNNDFSACCNRNDYQFGKAVISIMPEIPHPDQPYHRQIRIVQNRFVLSDHAVLFAFSVAGLEFIDNHVHADHTRCPRHPERPLIKLRQCPEARIHHNHLDHHLHDRRFDDDGVISILSV